MISLRLQTYQNFEVILVNDGSKDDSAIVIETILKNSIWNSGN